MTPYCLQFQIPKSPWGFLILVVSVKILGLEHKSQLTPPDLSSVYAQIAFFQTHLPLFTNNVKRHTTYFKI